MVTLCFQFLDHPDYQELWDSRALLNCSDDVMSAPAWRAKEYRESVSRAVVAIKARIEFKPFSSERGG